MDNQKQIEEMAYLICDMTSKCVDCSKYECKSKDICTKLYNAGYRKIPENSVVLTREELNDLEYKAYARGVNSFNTLHEKQLSKTRKETAEKFAENAKMKLKDKLHKGKSLHAHVLGKEYVQRIFKEVIDKTCKEFTEGKI